LEAIGDHWRKKMLNHSWVEPLVGSERVGVGEDVVPEPTRDEQHCTRLEFTIDPQEVRVRDRVDVEPFVPTARGPIGTSGKRGSIEKPHPLATKEDP
jgi:hypothetical protein